MKQNIIEDNTKITIIYYYCDDNNDFQKNKRYLYTYEIDLNLFKKLNPDYKEKNIFLYHYLIDVDNNNKNNKIDIYFDTEKKTKQKCNTENCINLVQNVWDINNSQKDEISKTIIEHQKNDDEYLKYTLKRNEISKKIYSIKRRISKLNESNLFDEEKKIIDEYGIKIKELDKENEIKKKQNELDDIEKQLNKLESIIDNKESNVNENKNKINDVNKEFKNNLKDILDSKEKIKNNSKSVTKILKQPIEEITINKTRSRTKYKNNI